MAVTSTGIDLEYTWDQALTGLQSNRDIGGRRVGHLRPYNLLGVTDSPTAPAEQADADATRYRYTAELAGRIERDWQDNWTQWGTFNVPNPVGSLAPTDRPPQAGGAPTAVPADKMFVQDMFPYPSGEGLHVGHPLGYIATDVYARYFRMVGRNVLHALGFDAFGLPAEQYAVQTGTHPRTRTEANIVNFRRQLGRLGFGHDSRRSFSTTDVEFYKWTQWIFLQIYNAWFDSTANKARPITDLVAEFDSGARQLDDGRDWVTLSAGERADVVDGHRLVYRADSMVNWCPGLGTVLANEEVTADGRSERGNFPVFRKRLRQWMMRITAYSDRLLDDLDVLDWPEKVKTMQRNWIGRSTGAAALFSACTADGDAVDLEVFTTRPDTLFGATYLVLAPEHDLVDRLVAAQWPDGTDPRWTFDGATPAQAVAAYRQAIAAKSDLERQESKAKTGVFLGSYAINPATGEQVPVFIADYVLAGYGTGAIMAVPGHDQRDWEFAREFGLPIIEVIAGGDISDAAYAGEGVLVNSGYLDKMNVAAAKAAIIARLESDGRGWARIEYKPRGNATGASRSRSSMTAMGARTRWTTRRCRLNCPMSRTTRRCCSTPTTPAASRRRRWPRRPTGCTSSWTSAMACSPTPATPTSCRSGRAVPGTSCVTPTRTTQNVSAPRRMRRTGWGPGPPSTGPTIPAASTSTSEALSMRCCTCCIRGSGTRCSTTSVMSAPASPTDG